MKDQSSNLLQPFVSILEDLPPCSSELERAMQLIIKSRGAGFDWLNIDGVFAKIEEELDEIRVAVKARVPKAHLEEEIGNLFFACMVLCHWLHVNHEKALLRHNQTYIQRFQELEKRLHAQGLNIQTASQETLEGAWQIAKKLVKNQETENHS